MAVLPPPTRCLPLLYQTPLPETLLTGQTTLGGMLRLGMGQTVSLTVQLAQTLVPRAGLMA